MDEDITEDKALLFLLLRKYYRRQNRTKKRKKPRLWVGVIFRKREQNG